MLLIPNTFTVISAVQMQQSCCKCVKVYLTHLDNAYSSFTSKCSQLKLTERHHLVYLWILSNKGVKIH